STLLMHTQQKNFFTQTFQPDMNNLSFLIPGDNITDKNESIQHLTNLKDIAIHRQPKIYSVYIINLNNYQ
ncbi:hypothetical protein RCT70_04555, partial [Escherichia marmotae]|nr:hypothetical protein [Escherichia marmotae]